MSQIIINVTVDGDGPEPNTLRWAINELNTIYNPANLYQIDLINPSNTITINSPLPPILYPVNFNGHNKLIDCNNIGNCMTFEFEVENEVLLSNITFTNCLSIDTWGVLKLVNVNTILSSCKFINCSSQVLNEDVESFGTLIDITNGNLIYRTETTELSGITNCSIMYRYSSGSSFIYSRNCIINFVSLSSEYEFVISDCYANRDNVNPNEINVEGIIINTDIDYEIDRLTITNFCNYVQSGLPIINAGGIYSRASVDINQSILSNMKTNSICTVDGTAVRINRGLVYNEYSNNSFILNSNNRTFHSNNRYTIFYCIFGVMNIPQGISFTDNVDCTAIIVYGNPSRTDINSGLSMSSIITDSYIFSGASTNLTSTILPFTPTYYGTGINLYNCSTSGIFSSIFSNSHSDPSIENSSHGIVIELLNVNDVNIAIYGNKYINLTSNGSPVLVVSNLFNRISFSSINIFENTSSIVNPNISKVAYGKGGGIYCKGFDSVALNNNITFTNTYCSLDGGAIYFDTQKNEIQIFNLTMEGTKARRNGGAIYINNLVPNLINNYITINQCMAGVNSDGTRTEEGGNGGGMYIDSRNYINEFSFNNYYFNECIAYGNGGGLYLVGVKNSSLNTITTLNPSYNLILNNCSANQGALIYSSIAKIIFNNSDIISGIILDNESPTKNGSFVYNSDDSILELTNCNIDASQTSSMYNFSTIYNSGTLNISGCTIRSDNPITISQNKINTTSNIADSYFTYLSDTTHVNDGIAIYGGTININRCSIDTKNTGLSISQIQVIVSNTSYISNSTISGCVTNIIIDSSYPSTTRIINCTLYDSVNEGIYCFTPGTVLIGNTIINKFSGIAESIGNNLIKDNSGISVFTQPTDINNEDPLLGPYQNNGGIVKTYATMNFSPCLEKGDKALAVGMYDNRGEYYNRIVSNRIDIGAFENQNPIVCMIGTTKVLVGIVRGTNVQGTNVQGTNVQYAYAKDLCTGDTIVVKNSSGYIEEQKIVSTIISKTKGWVVKISKDSVEKNIPMEDTYITNGHVVVIDRKHLDKTDKEIIYKNYDDSRILIKARELLKLIKNCEKVRVDDREVYSFVLRDSNNIININGMDSITFGKDEWDKFTNRGIIYRTK